MGVGNTMDSYGDKFQPDKNNDYKDKKNGSNRKNKDDQDKKKDTNEMTSYDPYQSTKPLSEKIGVILDDVDKVNDGDNAETIKQKLGGKNKNMFANKKGTNDDDFFGFDENKKQDLKKTEVSEVNFLD